MDLNTICISGRVFDMGFSPTYTQNGGVAEGKISVDVGTIKGETMYEEFCIRSYGKKSVAISRLEDGTPVTIQGRLREDLRVNNDGQGVRSKTYVNIDCIKVMSEKSEMRFDKEDTNGEQY